MSDRRTAKNLVSRIGTFYGIGVGPGDPELLTLKAYRLIRTLPRLYAPVSRPGASSYAKSIVAEHLDPGHSVVELPFAMRAAPGEMAAQWRANAAVITEDLRAGRDVGFLTEGDPLLYSTFVHLVGALKEVCPEAPVVAVPGVSSFQAAAAATGIPLVDRGERLAILPAGYEDLDDGAGVREALERFDTVVLFKVASAIDQVIGLLEELGRTDRAVLVSRCGRPDEQIIRDVRSLRGRKLDYFSLMILRK